MQILKKYFRRAVLSILVGLMGGAAAAVFLISLNWATNYRDQNHWLLYFLPLAGLCIGYAYYKYGKNSEGGTGLILEEIHDPKKTLPLRMAPFVLVGTVLTHLFGGSAGREGTAVQMGAALADQLTKFFKISKEERRTLLVSGAGAGFSAAIGAPWAGTLFGLEVMEIGRLPLFALFESFIASFVAFYFCRLLGAPHSHFPFLGDIDFNLLWLAWAALAGLAFGIAANLFIRCAHAVEKLQKKYVAYSPLRPFVGGLIVVALFLIPGTYRYAGLGISSIQESFAQTSTWYDPWVKMIFTALTIGSGFKGGEFIPLVFIGTTLGSFLTLLIPVPTAFMAALGFAAVFGAAANTPFACTIMAAEIFGWSVLPYALVSCAVAYYMTGHLGIYKNQKMIRSKKDQLLRWLPWKQKV